MRLSSVRTAIVASISAAVLAACGGHGIVPQGAAPGNAFNAIPLATNPCYTKAVQPSWIFKGSCKITKLPSNGITITLKAYKGIKSTTKLPKNNSKGNPSFVVVDATGSKDISKYKGASFPLNKAGKSVVYVQAVNSYNGLAFTSGNLVLSATATKLPSKSCHFYALTKRSTKYSWFPVTILPKVTGNTATVTIPATDVGILFPPPKNIPKGPLFFNLSC